MPMPRPARSIVIRILTARPRKRKGGWSPRSLSLLLLRKKAAAGLFRDGGVTAAEVCRYVRGLRQEVEREVASRGRKRPKHWQRVRWGITM
jgi:hypothetical protein